MVPWGSVAAAGDEPQPESSDDETYGHARGRQLRAAACRDQPSLGVFAATTAGTRWSLWLP